MRIALISYEYPPDTAYGGIATYTYQWAHLLMQKDYDVEVFCGSESRTITETEGTLLVHRIKVSDRGEFKFAVLEKFKERHFISNFDIIESPELNSDGKIVKEHFPEIKLVVKLHTPSFLINQLNNPYSFDSFKKEVRFKLGAWRRLRGPNNKNLGRRRIEREERDFVKLADYITCPSKSLAKITYHKWNLEKKINHLPNPYIPAKGLLEIQINENQPQFVTFVGRLERRKGILSFIDIIPKVVKKYPDLIFRFIGKDTFDTVLNTSVKKHLMDRLIHFLKNIEFQDHVSLSEIPQILKQNTICVFPSTWENFPTVCLEAMSAAKPIVGSNKGGMKDMLEEPVAGILVNPANSNEIVKAIFKLLSDKQLRMELAFNAREKVLSAYNAEVVMSTFEKIIRS